MAENLPSISIHLKTYAIELNNKLCILEIFFQIEFVTKQPGKIQEVAK